MKGLITVVMWLVMASTALAAGENTERAALGETVRVRIWSVHATKSGAQVDEALAQVSKHLKRLDYGTFKLIRKDGIAVPPKGTRKAEIAGGKTVRVTVIERNEERARVRVRIGDGNSVVLDTTVAIRRNGFFIVAGPRYKGGILVLPIFARY